MNKHRYQKPQAVKDLERQALDHFRREHPDFPEHAIPSQFYRDDTANGLTKCIVDYIRYNGGQAERINTMGSGRYPQDLRCGGLPASGWDVEVGQIHLDTWKCRYFSYDCRP